MTTCITCAAPIDRPATKAGECQACYYYRRRHGQPRPQHLIERNRKHDPGVYACDPVLCPNKPTETRLVFGHPTRLCPACAAEFDEMNRQR